MNIRRRLRAASYGRSVARVEIRADPGTIVRVAPWPTRMSRYSTTMTAAPMSTSSAERFGRPRAARRGNIHGIATGALLDREGVPGCWGYGAERMREARCG